ncbi:MAG: type II 3-dehydroquinate dehydratase [Oscillospiraceae bacterium]|jgi:3-dehydroquinate dehydratase-2|nr:type II 3-dehydroquinate dehydratase [Oscillospiraceae bacterium]
MTVWIINGPNLNMLGIREPEIYGKETLADLERFCRAAGAACGAAVEFFQSNHEGELVTMIQQALGRADGIVINPAAYTHTSVAILDALKAVALPAVEVHLSDVSRREEFRRVSYSSLGCRKVIAGKGFEGYREAIGWLTKLTEEEIPKEKAKRNL